MANTPDARIDLRIQEYFVKIFNYGLGECEFFFIDLDNDAVVLTMSTKFEKTRGKKFRSHLEHAICLSTRAVTAKCPLTMSRRSNIVDVVLLI